MVPNLVVLATGWLTRVCKRFAVPELVCNPAGLEMCESVFKLLIIDDTSVCKTSMVAWYCYSKWFPTLKAGVGGEFGLS